MFTLKLKNTEFLELEKQMWLAISDARKNLVNSRIKKDISFYKQQIQTIKDIILTIEGVKFEKNHSTPMC